MTVSLGNATTALTITAQHEAPQAFAREVPDAVDQPLTADDAPYQVVAGDDAPRVFEEVLIAEDECISVARIAPDGTVTVNPDIPRGGFQVAITSPLRRVLNNEDTAELARLEQRAQAEPTSFRAQQELQSFKALKGVA